MTPEEFDALKPAEKQILRKGLSELGQAACDYAEMGFSIFPLIPRTKIPAIEGGFTNADDDWEFACYWWMEHPYHNIGIATGAASNGLVVVDVDQDESKGEYGEESLWEWEQANGKLPETVCATTGSGGIHYYFRTSTSVASNVNKTLCIDRRGEKAYVVAPPSVHPDGTKYEWDLSPYDYDIAFADNRVLEFFAYCDVGDGDNGASSGVGGDSKYEFPEIVHDGEGREHNLVTYAFSLRAQGNDFDTIFNELSKINLERVVPPKSDKDIKRIAKSVCRKPAGLSPEYAAAKERAEKRKAHEAEMAAKAWDEYCQRAADASIEDEECLPPINPEDFILGKNGLNHALVGEDMIKRFHFCFLGGTPVTWVGDKYETGWKAVKRQLSQYKYTIRESERKEVCLWLENNAPEKEQAPWNYIAFKNGVLDIKTMNFTPRSPKYLIPNVIPHNWNPEAQSDLLDETLWGIASGEEDTLANIHEMIGLSMYRGTFISKAFFIINNRGRNGKSTFIHLLEKVLGKENISTVDPLIMGERFQSTPMMGKLANYTDDLSPDFVKASSLSILKKVITGDTIPYEIKGGSASNFKPYCTCIFTMNKMPPLGDGTGGMMRRIHPVSFHACFDENNEATDVHRSEKFDSEEVCEAAIVRGITALIGVVERGDVTHTRYSRVKTEEVTVSNNQVVQFVDEEEITAESLEYQETQQVFERYRSWAMEQGIQNMFTSVRFRNEMKDILGVEVKKTRKGNGFNRYKYVRE
jgi:P4 family phage/plasmid primase-like protien